MRMPWSRRTPTPAPVEPRPRAFLTDGVPRGHGRAALDAAHTAALRAMPVVTAPAGTAMDSAGNGSLKGWGAFNEGVPDNLLSWFASQGFIGHQVAAYIAQHWLVDKACRMPANDAVRHGFAMSLSGVLDDTQDDEIKALHKANVRLGLNAAMREYVGTGRVFGIRILIFKVESTDPMYYEYPFNPDAVTPGSYQGMVQVDPYWCAPELDASNVQDPAGLRFYQPTHWMIGGRRYHHTHLCIFRTSDVPTLLRPVYQYGGVPIPQRIYERVYAAERTANEAPQLAMTKRLTTYKTDLSAWIANADAAALHMENFTQYRDNYGVKVVDTDDDMTVQDTTLTDMDALIMTQYQLVAAAAQVPATKLLGTTPKGFNATGEYEESSYHEELETIQENDLSPLVQRHLDLLVRSEIEPKFGYAPGTLEASLEWNPVDSPTGKEQAEERKIDAETDAILVNAGAIDGQDVRSRLTKDKSGPYTDLPPLVEPLGVNPDDPLGLLEGENPDDALGLLTPPAPDVPA